MIAAMSSLLAGCAPVAPWDDPNAFPSARPPEADQLIARAADLMGGEQAIGRICILSTIADCEGPPGAFTTTVHAANGQRVVLRQVDAAGGEFVGYANGDIGWMRDPATGEHQPADAALRSMFLGHAFHHLALHLDDAFRDHELVGRSLFGDRLCWKVGMVDAFDSPAWAFLNVLHGRLEGLIFTVDAVDAVDAAPTITIFFSDWRDEGGLHLFHALALRHGAELWRYRFTDIRINDQDPAIFDVPPAVRDLLAAPPEAIAGDR